jgi:Undecaprenyl-phosphate glucose phosphotransferase
MFRRHGDKLSSIFLLCDVTLTSFAWVTGYWLRFNLLPTPLGAPPFRACARSLPLVILLAVFAYRACRLYELHRLVRLPQELATLTRASGLLFLFLITLAFYRRDPYESRLALGIFFLANIAYLALARRTLWKALRGLRRRGFNHGRALVVGTGRIARKTVREIQNNDWTGLEPIGYVDRPDVSPPDDLPILGNVDDLPDLVERMAIDFVFICLPLRRYSEVRRVYAALSNVVVDVQLVPDLPNLGGMRLRTSQIGDLVFHGVREDPHAGWNRVVKRTTDLVLGTVALIVAAPVMGVIALWIRLSSGRPVLYRQQRLGLGGRPFEMLKFRTMDVDAEKATGPVWATAHDDRCTPVGGFLRRTSLDELPQLFNVLRGDMSLVGPRPERSVFIRSFRNLIPRYMLRHSVKAGITGWAQVNGWRGDTSLHKRVQYDLYYINHWSFWLDLRILWLTALRMLGERNAY